MARRTRRFTLQNAKLGWYLQKSGYAPSLKAVRGSWARIERYSVERPVCHHKITRQAVASFPAAPCENIERDVTRNQAGAFLSYMVVQSLQAIQ